MKNIKTFIKKNKLFSALIVMSIIIALVAIFAPALAPYSPYDAELSNAFQAPSSEHLFGTDKLGRDVLSRVIYGTRISLSGTIAGILAGYFGGIVNAVIMRISDMMISFPGMVLAIAMAGIMGASVKNAVIANTTAEAISLPTICHTVEAPLLD